MIVRVRGACTSIALLMVLLAPQSALAEDFVLSGSLERLLDGSILVRLADDR